jgi:hypothetical protein
MKIGDRVTCRFAESAYYSRYAGRPEILFKPGMVGTIASITPKVKITTGQGKDSRPDFLVVDYEAPETGQTERVGLNYDNAVLLPKLVLLD